MQMASARLIFSDPVHVSISKPGTTVQSTLQTALPLEESIQGFAIADDHEPFQRWGEGTFA